MSTRIASRLDEALPTEKAKDPQPRAFCGDGARRTRTADLLGAIQALSQLSYSPGRAPLYRHVPGDALPAGLPGRGGGRA